MKENFKEILSSLNTEIDQETLLLYLQGKLSDEKKHEVEKQLADNDFDADAMEGLQEIKDTKQISYMVDALNRDLKKRVEKKKQRRQKLQLKDQTWLYVAVVMVILLIIISYFIIHRMMQKGDG